MPRNLRDRKTMLGALLASLALHALGTPFFARSSTSSESGAYGANGSANERVASTMVGRISMESRRTIQATRAPVHPAKPLEHRVRTSTPKMPIHPRSVAGDMVATRDPKWTPIPHAGDASVAGRARGAIAITIATAAPESPTLISRPSARERAEIVATATSAPIPTPKPLATAESTPVAIPSPTATAQIVAVRAESGIPPGGWGASFEKPIIADEGALDELRARYRGARTIRVDVDEAGHATRVVVPASMPTDLRAALEHDLLALRYVPAECNGLRCVGTLQLVL